MLVLVLVLLDPLYCNAATIFLFLHHLDLLHIVRVCSATDMVREGMRMRPRVLPMLMG